MSTHPLTRTIGDYTAGDLSLREAVGLANGSIGDDTVTFDAALTGSTISLVLGQLEILDDVVIMGLGADVLTIDAQGLSRVLQVSDSAMVDISGFTLTGGSDHRGGAIRNSDGGTVNVANSSISGNSATSGGGAIYNTGTLTVTGSTISGNSVVPSRGGGIFNSGMTTVINSTISGNSATYGGGILNHSTGTLNVTNSTISDNSATSYGGGIYDIGNANVSHSIVAGNMAPNDVDILIGSLDTDTFNLIGGDPMLGPLTNNGGLTLTHALLPGSPAIDMGNPAFDPNDFISPLVFDQRGIGFDRVSGTAIDIGAFEAQVLLVNPGDFNDDGIVNLADYTVWRDNLGAAGRNHHRGPRRRPQRRGRGRLSIVEGQFWEHVSPAAKCGS